MGSNPVFIPLEPLTGIANYVVALPIRPDSRSEAAGRYYCEALDSVLRGEQTGYYGVGR